ncbi:MAG: hypothetical protein JSV49_05395 [Thermoplasmata archaeon]|nr:MAG: hypothetical protein JSV49_05395 [Thermoplasmata archaeon]
MKIRISSKRKDLILTGHCRNELYDKYKKNLDLIIEILTGGLHSKESKEKSMVRLRTKKGIWELVYVETENELILIHLKFRR